MTVISPVTEIKIRAVASAVLTPWCDLPTPDLIIVGGIGFLNFVFPSENPSAICITYMHLWANNECSHGVETRISPL